MWLRPLSASIDSTSSSHLIQYNGQQIVITQIQTMWECRLCCVGNHLVDENTAKKSLAHTQTHNTRTLVCVPAIFLFSKTFHISRRLVEFRFVILFEIHIRSFIMKFSRHFFRLRVSVCVYFRRELLLCAREIEKGKHSHKLARVWVCLWHVSQSHYAHKTLRSFTISKERKKIYKHFCCCLLHIEQYLFFGQNVSLLPVAHTLTFIDKRDIFRFYLFHSRCVLDSVWKRFTKKSWYRKRFHMPGISHASVCVSLA